MSELSLSQISQTLLMICSGMVVLMMYQVFSLIKTLLFKNLFFSTIAEMLFWIGASGIVGSFLYCASYGVLSIHAIAGFFAGVFLWKCLYYKKLYDILAKGVCKCLDKRGKVEGIKSLLK